jgi:hypothetical protein
MIHIDIGKRRHSDDEDAYEKKLRVFADDREYDAIVAALNQRDYTLAEKRLNRLKIKSYNLGMVRLAKNCDELRLAILSGKDASFVADLLKDVTTVYGIMRECIDRAFHTEGAKTAKHRINQ